MLSSFPQEVLLCILEHLTETEISNISTCNEFLHRKTTSCRTSQWLYRALLSRRKFLLDTKIKDFDSITFNTYHQVLYKSLFKKYRILNNIATCGKNLLKEALVSYEWNTHDSGASFLGPSGTIQTCLLKEKSLMCVKVSCTFNTNASNPIALLKNVENHHLFEAELVHQKIQSVVDSNTTVVHRTYPHTQLCLLVSNSHDSDGTYYQTQHSISLENIQDHPSLKRMVEVVTGKRWTINVVGSGYVVSPIDTTSCTVTSVLQVQYTPSFQNAEFQTFITRARAVILHRLKEAM